VAVNQHIFLAIAQLATIRLILTRSGDLSDKAENHVQTVQDVAGVWDKRQGDMRNKR